MSFIGDAMSSIHFKIVYHGLGLVGKATSLRNIYERIDPSSRRRYLGWGGCAFDSLVLAQHLAQGDVEA